MGAAAHSMDEDAKSGQVPEDRAPGRIGFNEHAETGKPGDRIDEVDRVGARHRWFQGCMERAGISVSAARTRQLHSPTDLTAPLMSIIWLAGLGCARCGEGSQAPTFRVATNSLLFGSLFRNVCWLGSLVGSPPLAGLTAEGYRLRRPAHRPSLPHIPFLPVRTRLHPSLPQAPAGEVRWAERHDGKRDLYLQHAA